MKNKLTLLTLSVALIGLVSGCTKVPPGYVGIKVNQYGNQKGVEDFPLQTGMVWYNLFTSDVYQFPTFQQNVVWDKEESKGSPSDDSVTFNSIEGAVINADLALAYSFEASRVPHIFVEFRTDPDTITHGYMKNEINNEFNRHASGMKATDIFGTQKQKLLDLVMKDMNDKLGPKGFKFTLISFHGALRVDSRVQNSINAVLEASQKAIEAENKVRQSSAEADQAIQRARGEKESNIAKAEGESKAITLRADAQAKANETIRKSLSPELLQSLALEKWNGVLPTVTGSGTIPFINVTTTPSSTK